MGTEMQVYAPGGAVARIMKPGKYHEKRGIKPQSPEDIKLLMGNQPFKQYINPDDKTWDIKIPDNGNAFDVSAAFIEFLENTFIALVAAGVSFDFNEAGSEAERQLIERYITKRADMKAHVAKIRSEYELYLASCITLQDMKKKGLLMPGDKINVKSLGEALKIPMNMIRMRQGSGNQHAEVAKALADNIRFCAEKGWLEPSTVMMKEVLAEIFMAAPVWFVESKHFHKTGNGRIASSLPIDLDNKNHWINQILFGNESSWNNLKRYMLLFNLETRPFEMYDGDSIPDYIMDRIEEAKRHFDVVAIATPYLDIAGKEWEDPKWKINPDPFLLAFDLKTPHVFYMLGRWSNSGVFEALPEMMIDTIKYLEQKSEKAQLIFNKMFSPRNGTLYDTHGEYGWSLYDNVKNRIRTGNRETMVYFGAKALISSFQDGKLFEYLAR